MRNLSTIIIAGGKGTRIKKHFPDLPKILLKIKNKTLLSWYIEDFGKENLYLSLGVNSNKIIPLLDSININYSLEDKPLGTFGGLVKTVQEHYNDLSDNIVVVLGDLFCFGFNRNLKSRLDNIDDAYSYCFYSKNDHPFDSDRIEVGSKGFVKSIYFKGTKLTEFNNKTLSGIYIFKKKDIKQYSLDKSDITNDYLFDLCQRKELKAEPLNFILKDVGTIDRLKKFNDKSIKNLNHIISNKCVIFDLDGTIIENRGSSKNAYENRPKLISKSIELIKYCNMNDLKVIVMTNQGDIAKGFVSFSEIRKEFNQIERMLHKNNAKIDDIFFCPHYPESGYKDEIKALKINCSCRKPKTGMWDEAKDKWNLSSKKTIMIGDSDFDKGFSKNIMVDYFDIAHVSIKEIEEKFKCF